MYDYDRSSRTASSGDVGLWGYYEDRGTWVLERSCSPETAAQWLAVFQKQQPGIHFEISARKPKQPKGLESPRSRPSKRVKFTDAVVRRMLLHPDSYRDQLIDAARERDLPVASVTPRAEVLAALEKYLQRSKTGSAVNKKFDRYIALAADDLGKLRKSDVFRVLSEAKSAKELSALSAYIVENRADLKEGVADDAKDVVEEKGW